VAPTPSGERHPLYEKHTPKRHNRNTLQKQADKDAPATNLSSLPPTFAILPGSGEPTIQWLASPQSGRKKCWSRVFIGILYRLPRIPLGTARNAEGAGYEPAILVVFPTSYDPDRLFWLECR
jgi:hypothetical protein